MGEPDAVARELLTWLADHGYNPASTSMGDVRWGVARRTTRRLLTTIEVYIGIEAFPTLSLTGVREFTEAMKAHALASRTGRPLGMQAAEAVFPVAVSDSVEESVRRWTTESMPVSFATLCHPVVVDTSRNEVLFRTRPRFLGFVYFPFTRGVIETEIIPGVQLDGFKS